MLRIMTDVADVALCHDPVFILTGSRSGSTLLRFILDTHPEFACPPETMITAACVALLRSWDILENAGSGEQRLVTEPARLPDEAIDTVRGVVDRLYGSYLARRGKPRWCDKSLDSIFSADLLAELYPRARFVCLYRHCMDVVASGIEACPWGLSRYGFDSFVAQNPGNSVAAVGSYWAETVRLMLGFEERQPERCHRVRYEDLAAAPEEVTAGLLRYLGAAPAPGITEACFSTPHEGDGPGDEKIWFTTKISGDTIGRGINVPADALPPTLREEINGLLNRLDYRTIGPDWNDAPGVLDPRRSDTISVPGEPTANGAVSAATSVIRALRHRIGSRSDSVAEIGVRWPALAGETIALVVTDAAGCDQITWTFPAPDGNGTATEPPVATMIASPDVWNALLDGKANVIVEMRTGRLRCLNKRDTYRVRSDEVHAIAWLLGLAQVPLTRQPA